MTTTENWGLSETDCKLLLAFTEEQSMEDGLLLAGVKYAYGRKRVGTLKARGFLSDRRVGREVLLSTAHRAETEYLWKQALTKSQSKQGKGFHFRFAGQYLTFTEAMRYIGQRKERATKVASLTAAIQAAVQTVTAISFLQSENEPVLIKPTDVLPFLKEQIQVAELELQLAKEIYSHGILWVESPTVWKSITFGKPPSEATLQAYETMVRIVRKSQQIGEPDE